MNQHVIPVFAQERLSLQYQHGGQSKSSIRFRFASIPIQSIWPNHYNDLESCIISLQSITGWWLGHPSEKYESQLG